MKLENYEMELRASRRKRDRGQSWRRFFWAVLFIVSSAGALAWARFGDEIPWYFRFLLLIPLGIWVGWTCKLLFPRTDGQ